VRSLHPKVDHLRIKLLDKTIDIPSPNVRFPNQHIRTDDLQLSGYTRSCSAYILVESMYIQPSASAYTMNKYSCGIRAFYKLC